MSSLPIYTRAQVSSHNTAASCWVIIGSEVYDLTKFARLHPGGRSVIIRYAGQDVTEDFNMLHGEYVLPKYRKRLLIGTLVEEVSTSTTSTTSSTSSSTISTSSTSTLTPSAPFGAMTLYGDPTWYQTWHSPYYSDSHYRVRKAMRAFVDEHVMPNVDNWDRVKRIPPAMYEKCAAAGWYAGVIGPPWRSKYTPSVPIIGNVPDAEYDAFHELIIMDELARCGSGGAFWGLCGGIMFGLPAIANFASDEIKQRIMPEVCAGRKVICIAVTEPWAGSDVANMRTTATKSADGSHYIVNGEKKWITGGAFADYFTVAVRTGGRGGRGISLLLLDRSMPGLRTTQMDCAGMWGSGTSYITFDNVKVPASNLIGEENQGFKYIMYTFNHERWTFVVQANRFARVCLEESIKWATKRKTFGKRLIDHPVIRAKIGEMARHIEATHAWLEMATLQLCKMPKVESNFKLGGPIALMKVQASKTFEYCAREAVQIFGGTGYTTGNSNGGKVERLYREVRAMAIPGGSEEIMIDFAVRQGAKVNQQLLLHSKL
jgi:alkylation response protein AidB-like acyl-CoA dehydrogenase/predicted heme/steroid binding protein